MRNDSEYQDKINERRAKWKKEHAVFDKEGIKAEINDIKSQIEDIQDQINASLEKEKPLEKKVYFDGTGTEEEIKVLRQSVADRKKLQAKVDVLNNNMLDKQEIYKNEAQGKLINGDWKYDINARFSAAGKIEAAKISKYATENPYEAFTEGLLVKEKGQEIPESIEKVIEDAKVKAGVKNIEKMHSSDIIDKKKKII